MRTRSASARRLPASPRSSSAGGRSSSVTGRTSPTVSPSPSETASSSLAGERVVHQVARRVQLQPQAGQRRAHAVVQVAAHPAPLLLARRHQALPRVLQRVGQPEGRDRGRGGVGKGRHQLGIPGVEQRSPGRGVTVSAPTAAPRWSRRTSVGGPTGVPAPARRRARGPVRPTSSRSEPTTRRTPPAAPRRRRPVAQRGRERRDHAVAVGAVAVEQPVDPAGKPRPEGQHEQPGQARGERAGDRRTAGERRARAGRRPRGRARPGRRRGSRPSARGRPPGRGRRAGAG